MTRWYRAYAGTVTDAKLGEVALVANCSRSVAIAAWHCILENCAEANAGGEFCATPRRVAVILGEPVAMIEAIFQELQSIGMISGQKVCSWSKRQFESDSSTERSRKHRELKRNANAALQQRSATPPYTETDTEKNIYTVDLPKTGEANTPARRARASDLENPFFEQFWSAYPKREGSNPKQPASQKFSRACQAGIEPQEIIDAAKRYASECERTGAEPRFVAQAVTWLNQGRWRDYGAPEVALADGSKLPSFASDAEFDKWWRERMASNG